MKMDKHDAPSFQFYPKDFLSDPDVMQMNMAQKGAYITLLSFQWLNDGLPNNDSYIRNLLGATPKWKTLWYGIKHKFVEIDGKLYNKRLYKEKQKQIEHRKVASKAGKKGAEKRWQSHSDPTNSPMAKNSFSSSSSTSIATSTDNPPLSPLIEEGLYKNFNKDLIDEIYIHLMPSREVERFEKIGREMNTVAREAILDYLRQHGGDYETAISYVKERKRRQKEGKLVSKYTNFLKKDWVEYAPGDESNVFNKLKSETE